jgi:uncharacterized protein (TIGR03437 family)
MGRTWRVLRAALAAAALSAAATVVRQPYVQNVGTGHASILWTALENGEGEAECSSGSGAASRAAAQVREFPAALTGIGFTYYQYRVDFDGLSPGTWYRCAVRIDRETLSLPENAGLGFRTAAAGPFTFLALGDSGTGSSEQRQIAQRMLEDRPSLVLHTGDIVYPGGGYADQQAFYFDVYWRLMTQVPFFPSPGNHDYDTRSAEPYLAAHAVPAGDVPARGRGRYYSFDWGNTHFVSLDSSLSPASAGMREEMLEWLDRDLRRSRAFWRVVYLHHAPYSAGAKEHDELGRLVREHIAPILDRHEVPLLLNGHDHNYQRTWPIRAGEAAAPGAGVVYVTTGGGGAPLYGVSARPLTAVAEAAHHYLRADVDGPRMTVRALRGDGREIDRFTLAPPPRLDNVPLVNAASFTAEIAPGGLVSILGRQLAPEEVAAPGGEPLPAALGGVTAQLNGRPMGLLYASGSQVNAQVPPDVRGPATLSVTTPNGVAEAAVVVLRSAPAIFTVPSDEGLTAAVVHAGGGALVTSKAPAAAGERVGIYVTGLAMMESLAVQIGESTAPAESVEPVPGSAGVYRVDVRIPANLAGGRYGLQVRAGGTGSNLVLLTVR